MYINFVCPFLNATTYKIDDKTLLNNVETVLPSIFY